MSDTSSCILPDSRFVPTTTDVGGGANLDFRDIKSIADLRRAVPNERASRRVLERLRWEHGRYCPHCGSLCSWAITGASARDGLYECADCHLQFTVTTKTILHSTKLPLRTWLEAMFLILKSSKGIASVALARYVGVSQKTAWKMGHAIRLLMADPAPVPLAGVAEVDEKYLGGKPRPRTDGVKAKRGKGTKKQPIMVMVSRGGEARAAPIPNESFAEINRAVSTAVSPEAFLMTDGASVYRKVSEAFAGHEFVDHGSDEFARPGWDGGPSVHNNTAESLNALIERAKFGVFHMMSKAHMHRYLAKVTFRWNERYQVPVETPTGLKMVTVHTTFPQRMKTMFMRAFDQQLRRSESGGIIALAPA